MCFNLIGEAERLFQQQASRPMAAREDDAASKREAEEEDSCRTTMARTDADQKADLTVPRATAADVEECSDDEDHPIIRNLNLISRRNLMPPEWIEDTRKLHYEHQALINRVYDALENGEIESDSEDEDEEAAAAERSKRLLASVGLSGLNTVDGDEAIAVYPAVFYDRKTRPQEEDDHESAAAAAAEAPS